MVHSNLCISHLIFMIIHLQADYVYSQGDDTSQDVVSKYEPSLPVVVGLLCFMFFITIVILMYAKFCSRRASRRRAIQLLQPDLGLLEARFSGIDKKVIESLPSFGFSSLKGSKQGLECAICLSRYEEIEILRLLPKCRHAFHIHCIDQWLEKHSTCPLCRERVSAMDLTSFTYPGSFRLLGNQSELRENSDMELFVQREQEHQGSSRFSIGDSFRKIEKLFKQEELLIQEPAGTRSDDHHQEVFHKFNHKIVSSDVLLKNRWSNVSSSDLVFLNSDIFDTNSSSRFSDFCSDNRKLTNNPRHAKNNEIMKIKEEMEMKILFESRILAKQKRVPEIGSTSSNANAQEHSVQMSKYVNPGEKRSMSEITGLSRYEDFRMKNKMGAPSLLGNNVKNERVRQLWLPIARRTAKWLANKERRSQAAQDTTESVDV